MRLTKIYTRSGDKGKTRLADGTEVSKNSLYVSAYGDVDELNSLIGFIVSQDPSEIIATSLSDIQHHLFNLGGELASAGTMSGMVTAEMIEELEKQVDQLNRDLPQLEEFILPGGTRVAASLHLARTVCRRAERNIITLSQSESIDEKIIAYVNRLSDLFFVMARYENLQDGGEEILWKNPRR